MRFSHSFLISSLACLVSSSNSSTSHWLRSTCCTVECPTVCSLSIPEPGPELELFEESKTPALLSLGRESAFLWSKDLVRTRISYVLPSAFSLWLRLMCSRKSNFEAPWKPLLFMAKRTMKACTRPRSRSCFVHFSFSKRCTSQVDAEGFLMLMMYWSSLKMSSSLYERDGGSRKRRKIKWSQVR